MRRPMSIPKFKTEAEEAAWWDNHRDEIIEAFEQASNDGMLSRGTLARQARSVQTSIRLNTLDIELAKKAAKKLGMRYQTYLKMIIHQHLSQGAMDGKNE